MSFKGQGRFLLYVAVTSDFKNLHNTIIAIVYNTVHIELLLWVDINVSFAMYCADYFLH